MEVYEFPKHLDIKEIGEKRDRDSTKPTYGLE